jgi:hypothetical protein
MRPVVFRTLVGFLPLSQAATVPRDRAALGSRDETARAEQHRPPDRDGPGMGKVRRTWALGPMTAHGSFIVELQ